MLTFFYYCFSLCYHRCFFTLSFTFNTSISFTLSQSVKIISFYDPFFVLLSFLLLICVNTKSNKWWSFLETIFFSFFFYNRDDLILLCLNIHHKEANIVYMCNPFKKLQKALQLFRRF